MKSMRKFVAVAMFSLAAVWTGSALAGPKGHGGEARGPRPELSAEQKAERDQQRKALAAAVRAGDVAKVESLSARGAKGEQRRGGEGRERSAEQQAEKLQAKHSRLDAAARAKLVEHWLQRAEGKHPGHGGERGPLADLKLSDAQKQSLAKLRGAPLDEASKAKRIALIKSFATDKFDAKALVAAQPKRQLRGQGKLAELVKVLTPEQRAKLAERIEAGPARPQPRSK